MRIFLRVLMVVSALSFLLVFFSDLFSKIAKSSLYFLQEKMRTTVVVIPEGVNKEEIAWILEERGIVSREDFLNSAADKEGYLFPDTYIFLKNSSADKVVERMVTNFQKRTSSLNPKKEDIILASIVERESSSFEEKRIIAGIYLNRLKMDMPLEADPTVQYAKYTDLKRFRETDGKPNYWAKITSGDYYTVNSPYNTYLHKGLPKGPICNPGLDSIKAVLNPKQTDYLYFFHSQGQIYFSKTLEEHKEKKKLYLED